MSKQINLEFLYPVADYFATSQRNDLRWDFFFPILFSLLLLTFRFCSVSIRSPLISVLITNSGLKALASNLIPCSSIIFAFSMACTTIFITSTNKNIEETKTSVLPKATLSKKYYIYDQLLSTYTYTLIVASFVTISVLIQYLCLCSKESTASFFAAFWTSINIMVLLHIFFVSIRSITALYFILWKKEKKK